MGDERKRKEDVVPLAADFTDATTAARHPRHSEKRKRERERTRPRRGTTPQKPPLLFTSNYRDLGVRFLASE
ncbi:hypothetical protein U1Q18_017833, partial [Sarracenia purpurea var. burkii]